MCGCGFEFDFISFSLSLNLDGVSGGVACDGCCRLRLWRFGREDLRLKQRERFYVAMGELQLL